MKSGWNVKKIGQICTVIAGQSPEGKYYNNNGKGIPFYQGKKEFTDRFIGMPTTWTTKVTKISEQGDILMSVRAPVGPVNFATQKICIGRGLAAIRTSEIIDKEFLFYYLQLNEQKFIGTQGAVFNSINKKQIEDISLHFPTLSQQKQIVAVLNEAFAAIDKAKENVEKNLKNTKHLFESYLLAHFNNDKKRWVEKKLKDVCTKITDGTHQTPKYFPEGYVFLSSKNVTSGKINWDNVKYIDHKQHIEMRKRVAPQLNDILLAKNGTTGIAAIVDRDTVFDIYVSLALLRVLDEVLPEYMLYFVNSPIAKKQFNKRLKGIGVPNLHLEEIREVLIRFPESKNEQQFIINKLNGVKEEVNKLELVYKNKIRLLDELKKSILHKAFNGDLNISKQMEAV